MAGVSDECILLCHAFNGADIRWNCKKVSERGVVAKLSESFGKLKRIILHNL